MFWIRKNPKAPSAVTPSIGEKVRGRWVSELPQEEDDVWGHYKGYLELPGVSFFDGAAGGTLVFHFAALEGISMDYPTAALLKVPPALSNDELLVDGTSSVLKTLFRGIVDGKDDNNLEEDLTPNSLPFPDASPEIEKEKWAKVFPEEVMERFGITQQTEKDRSSWLSW